MLVNKDTRLHEAYQILTKEIRWRDFGEAGRNELYYLWYSAGNHLYIIYDLLQKQYFFAEANNPSEALDKLLALADEAEEGGYRKGWRHA